MEKRNWKRCFVALMIVFSISFALSNLNGIDEVKAASNLNGIEKVQAVSNDQWNYTFGGINSDFARSIIGTDDGGYAIGGGTRSHGAGDDDFWLVKTDANGQAEWNETYGGKNGDTITDTASNSLIQAADGGFVLIGNTFSYGAGERDLWLVKTDANGQAQWNKTYGGASDDVAVSVIQTTDGGYALLGGTESYGTGDGDVWLVKTDADGLAQWNYTFGGIWGAYSVIQTGDGGYALAGIYSHGADGGGLLIKTDVNGLAQWNRTFDRFNPDDIYGVFLIQVADGGYVLAGSSVGSSGGLMKTDANGQVQWNNTYVNPSTATGVKSLIQTADGGYALTGWISIEDSGKAEDCWLIKIDADGQMEWEKIFGGKETDIGNDLLQAADGDLIIAGWTHSYGAGVNDMWLLKTPDAPPTTITTPSAPGLEFLPLLLAVPVLVFWHGWKKRPAFRQKKE